MINILSAEWMKLRRSKAFKICAIISMLFGFTVMGTFTLYKEVFTPEMIEKMSDSGMLEISADILNQDLTGQVILSKVFSNSNLQLVFAVFTGIFVAMEFSNGTMKNIASKGYSRVKLYFGKVCSCSLATIFMCIIMIIPVTVVATIVYGFGPVNKDVISDLLLFILIELLLNITITMLFTSISMMVRSTSISIAITVLITMFLPMILGVVDMAFQNEYHITQYWVGQAIMDMSKMDITGKEVVQQFILAIIYGAGSFIIGTRVFMKSDIK